MTHLGILMGIWAVYAFVAFAGRFKTVNYVVKLWGAMVAAITTGTALIFIDNADKLPW